LSLLEEFRREPTPEPPIRSLERFISKIQFGPSCWIWKGNTNGVGYGIFLLSKPKQAILAHRIAHALWNGPVGEKWVLHSCDNRACVNPFHLRTGTQAENLEDAMARGRMRGPPSGEMNHNAKLSWKDVREIRSLKGKLTIRELAKQYGVKSHGTIRIILAGETWKE